MQIPFNFPINSNGMISTQFLKLGFADFSSAADFIENLPYQRNLDKQDLLGVLTDGGGTCSTKHALLKNLAIENDFADLKLMLGIFLMNENNTSKIKAIFRKYNLNEMPEAHNYLLYQNHILDYTRRNSNPEDFIDDLVIEIEIQPSQITDFKVKYHRDFLNNYLKQNPHIPYNLEDFWKIREECIQALQV